jgi:hypothetical protein
VHALEYRDVGLLAGAGTHARENEAARWERMALLYVGDNLFPSGYNTDGSFFDYSILKTNNPVPYFPL